MRLRSLIVFLLFAWVTQASVFAAAQVQPADNFPAAPISAGAQQIEVGDAAVALMGPWKFRLGNDPSWALPGFDDSGWQDYTIQRQGWPTQIFTVGETGDSGWAGMGHLPWFTYSLVNTVEYVFPLFSLLASQWLLGLERNRWMSFAVLGSWTIFYCSCIVLFIDEWFVASPQLFKVCDEATASGMVLMLAVLVWIAVAGVRAQGAEAWLMLSPWLLTALSEVGASFFSGHARGVTLFLLVVGLGFLVPVSVLAILAYRFLHQWREHQALLRDRAEAHAVQQVVIAEDLPKTPGLAIEAEYRPAQEVGGDFFQVLPNGADGSVLIVVGDVTGKGLQAALMVSLIVGTIRTMEENTSDPQEILEALNRRLCSYGHAQATCMAMRVDRNGSVRLANAGHLPPYCNGEELNVAGSLPLGMLAAIEYEEQAFRLERGDRWMLFSDGVVEAANGKKELFGFDRVRAVSGKSAAEIAQAAESFGQQDDITVLTLSYQPVVAEMALREHSMQ